MIRLRSALLAAVCASLAVAQDPAAEGKAKVARLQQQFQELQQKVQRDFDGLNKLPESQREDAGNKIYGEYQKAVEAVVDELVAIATADHGEAGLAAIQAGLGMNATKNQRTAMLGELSEHFAADAAIAAVLPKLRYVAGKSTDALLKKVVAENPAKAAKGMATFVMAMRAKEDAREKLLEQCVAEFADVPYQDATLGKVAERQLYALRNLKIGGTAPEIAGADMDGKPMKLSEHRGKVVVLDFWGYW